MRVRSLLLGVCLVVVPVLAMCPHQVPPELAAAVRETVWRPVASWAGWNKPDDPPPASSAVPADDGPIAPLVSAGVKNAAPAPPMTGLPSSPPVAPVATPGRTAAENRLLQLGATSIDCQPLPGGDGAVLASCRMAVDPSGQLQRVFQVSGREPAVTLERLVHEVEAWRRRVPSQAAR